MNTTEHLMAHGLEVIAFGRILRQKEEELQPKEGELWEALNTIHMLEKVTNRSVVDESYGEEKIQEYACLESSEPWDGNWIRLYWKENLGRLFTYVSSCSSHEERIVHVYLKPANFLLPSAMVVPPIAGIADFMVKSNLGKQPGGVTKWEDYVKSHIYQPRGLRASTVRKGCSDSGSGSAS
ncbi:hypothetical protein R1sor_002668 [Riccia sorocarpa]|uniref:Uncharacterized protein n=1 Tax=Riccia sorocarpa TaxID=122646 RepID=A0ABD3H1K1_9MARC